MSSEISKACFAALLPRHAVRSYISPVGGHNDIDCQPLRSANISEHVNSNVTLKMLCSWGGPYSLSFTMTYVAVCSPHYRVLQMPAATTVSRLI